jgi:SSS family solute:Na+ symporter
MAPVDYLIVGVFFLGILGMGAYFRKWVGSPDDFYVAGRMLPPALLAATLAASNINLYNFVGYGGRAYEHGVSIIWHEWTGMMCLVLSGLLVLPLLRRLRVRTIPEFLEMRYSREVRILVAVLWLLRLAFTLGIILYLCGVVAQQVTGTEARHLLGIDAYFWWLVVFAFVGVLTTFMGGAWSVALTDALQFVLLLGGFLVMFPLVMHEVGGVQALIEQLPADRFEFVPKNGEFSWSFIIAIWLLGVQWACTEQGMIQRGLSGKGARTVAKGMVLSGIIMVPFALLIVLPGMAASILHPGLANADEAVPRLVSGLPSILLGLILCGFLASQLSTVDSAINSGATLFTHDLYRFLRKTTPSPKTILFVARTTTLVLGALAVLIGWLVIPSYKSAVHAYLDLIGVMDMPLFVVAVIFGLLWRRANWKGAFVGYLGGAAAAYCMGHVFIDGFLHPEGGWYSADLASLGICGFLLEHRFLVVTLTGMTAALLLCPAVSLLTRPPDSGKVEAVWRSRESAGDEEAESFNVMPKSRAGKRCMLFFAAGLVLFLAGTFSGAGGAALAAPLAIGGMVVYFAAGFLRLKYE